MKEKKAKMPSNERIREAARRCSVAKDTLKELWPEAFEEEIELRNGQIYRVVTDGMYKGNFYLLISIYTGGHLWWKLVSLKTPGGSWSSWRDTYSTKASIKISFELCSRATISVRNKKAGSKRK